MVDADGPPGPGLDRAAGGPEGPEAMRPRTVVAVALLVLGAACTAQPGGDEAAMVPKGPTGQAAAAPRPPVPATRGTRTVAVYYLRALGGRRYLVPEWHPVPATAAVPAAAVTELLRGRPLFPGSRPPFPAGTRLRGTRLAGATLTVDLSREALRAPPGDRRWALQALVRTATQSPAVARVLLAVEGRGDGRPLVRDPRFPLAPIALSQPAPGALLHGGRVVLRGEAAVAGGTVSLRLRDAGGRVVAQGSACSAGCAAGRVAFAGSLEFTPPAQAQRWTLEAFELRPSDGARLYWVSLPVWVGR
jgi:Sporulation and spore germination/Immunoglobulin-like domain of bacterial spore germination